MSIATVPSIITAEEISQPPYNDKWHWFQTPMFTASYPKLDPENPETSKRGAKTWSVTALFKAGEQCNELRKAVAAAIFRQFKTLDPDIIGELKSPFKDQREKIYKVVDGKKVAQPGYTAGALMCTFRMNATKEDRATKQHLLTGKKPGLVKRLPNGQHVLVTDPKAEFYGGAVCVAKVRFYFYNIVEEGARGIRAEFMHVLKVRDGATLGAPKVKPEDAFAPLDLDDSELDADLDAEDIY